MERIVIALLICSFFVGITYGFPSTTVTADEMIFVGGAFRALESHAIIPLGTDVPYGTINYLLSYAVMAVVLIFLWPFLGFNLSALKNWVINHHYLFYLIPRSISILAAIGLLILTYKLLKEKISSISLRLMLLAVLFTNLLTACILKTGKVWPLSTFFAFASFYFLYRVLAGDKRASFKAVIFSALAVANFPLAGLSLVAWPILFFVYRQRRWPLRELARHCLWGLLLIMIVVGFNYHGIIDQVRSIIFDYTLAPIRLEHNIPIIASFGLNAKKIFLLFAPFFLLMAVLIKRIRDKKLFYLGLLYLAGFYVTISVVARWSNDIYSGLRYLFPIGFFLTAAMAGCDLRKGKLAKIFAGLITFIVLIYFILALSYLMRPLTMGVANDWVAANLNRPNIVIINPLGPLFELPLNKVSADQIKEDFCALRCQAARAGQLQTDFLPTVIGEHSNMISSSTAELYYVRETATSSPRLQLVYSITNPSHYNWLHELDTLGDYFDPTFFRLHQLGDNIYLYKQIANQ